jgi:1-deoxy-D-xylulose-5-phosphate reductoisomerase
MVQFEDGTVKAHLSHPDMRIPIQFALTYPQRLPLCVERLSFEKLGQLIFSPLDVERFPCLSLAYGALEKGGNTPCILNAANEIAVEAFLKDQISFHQISLIVEKTIQKISFIPQPTLADIHNTDTESRLVAQNLLIKS